MRFARRRLLLWSIVSLVGGALLVFGFLFLSGLGDFDLSGYETQPISFEYDGFNVSGTLHRPEGKDPPVVLIVHGDGPQDRYSGGGYLPLIRVLLDSGIAVYSWDKPGVGASQGDWLDFSMQDRANLADAALERLTSLLEIQNSAFGFLGFSQAGWVLPHVGQANGRADFLVLVGGAIDWQRQGQYFTRKRLEADGTSSADIDAEIRKQSAHNQTVLGESADFATYQQSETSPSPMSEQRYRFVRKNWRSNATVPLTRATKPFLTVHGSEDLNVDPNFNSAQYRALLENTHPANRFEVVSGATHGLLRASLFNYQRPDQMPGWTEFAFIALGREAYAPGTLDTIITWIHHRAEETQPERQ
ncbi:alpha/beta hydrolase family protein [Roseibium sp.]|uniref:alpha/beta hydrolase family protein n=1 Tax=Roseibium sp. TaxID=1936156 RepID=UPI003B5301C5